MSAEQHVPHAGRSKGTKFWMAMLGITLAALLIFAALAVVFYTQAQDYRSAKYKAQYVLVDEIITSIPLLDEAIGNIVDDLLDNGFRRSAATYAQATAESISGACHSIEVMYPVDDDRGITFSALKVAFSMLAQTTETAYNQLTDPTPDVSEAVETGLLESAVISLSVCSLVSEGIDPEILLEDVSYDLADRMNLATLLDEADALQAAQP
jgi:hypothetical protein